MVRWCYALAAACLVVVAVLAAVLGEAVPRTYEPTLGDLMTMTVQPRHAKLALAGREQNWPYAAYELHELGEAFKRVAHLRPRWRHVPVADMIKSVVKAPMDAMAQAISAHDQAGFAAAYGRLTDACNACHQSAERGMVVIQAPSGVSRFPDQDFRPVKP